ncbi:MAG TPA: CoA-acylating methylmalonate-semialdehyde dehydrogenase [Longimicrobiales bacterium]|nr:CoA-acylating methylmalonate-semialdehyde dehydrogenase [Longimicrobiales bacterium]
MQLDTLPNFVAGQWQRAAAAETLDVINPATGELLGRTPMSDARDVGAAVEAARQAFPAWRATPPIERARILFRLKSLLEQHADALSASITREHGKNVAESRGELQRGVENIEHACGSPTLLLGETLEDAGRGIDCETFRQPLGVYAAITPYNFPVMIPLWFWPYAIATGNTFVLKPSEQDPITHQQIVQLTTQAGLPPGVLNVVHGGRDTVLALLEHPDVVGVSFVGSTRTARFVYGTAAAHGKRVQALGGAKNHMIVLPDADLDLATESAVSSAFGCTGQRCLAGSIVVGVGDAYTTVRDRVLERAAALRLGDGLDDQTVMGPVITAQHRARVRDYIDQGERGGARLLLDGRSAIVPALPRGHWIGATVFDAVTPDMKIGTEEIFGPVLGFTRVDSIDEAVELMHKSSYGNTTSLFTRSGAAAREFRYRAGISMIGINVGVAAPMAVFPFGGSRGSFYGDLKAQGRDAIEFYTDKRVVISRW